MKMSKKYKRICLAFGLGTALCATAVSAANYTKTITATYRNIDVTYNGASKTLSAEPFLVDGSTYVPLRAVSEIMGADVKWNGTTNTVTITNAAGSADSTALEQQLATANYQVTTLQRELENVKKELETYKTNNSTNNSSSTSGTDITSAELTATEKFLSDTYADYFDDIYFDFDITKKGARLQLEISYSDRKDDTAFLKLRESKITDMLESVCSDISSRHKNIDIQGTITYTKNDIDRATFSYTAKTGRLRATCGLDVDSVKETVEDNLTKMFIQGYANSAVKDVDVSANNSNSTVNIRIYLDAAGDSFTNAWKVEENRKQIQIDFQRDLKSLCNKIDDDTDYAITIDVYTFNSSTYLASYDYKSDSLSLK
ncbi:copper amine oxidase N-terminal domain-containing protein [Cellulosilyticum ruminicola]